MTPRVFNEAPNVREFEPSDEPAPSAGWYQVRGVSVKLKRVRNTL